MNDENEMDKNEAYLMGQTSGKLNNTEKKIYIRIRTNIKIECKKEINWEKNKSFIFKVNLAKKLKKKNLRKFYLFSYSNLN